MARIRVMILVLLVSTTGCLAVPFDRPINQERPVTFVAENSINTTYAFEVFVVQRPANVTYHLNDGRTGTLPITEGVSTNDPGANRTYTNVQVPDSARLHGRFRVAPGESNQSSIENLPRNFAVVVVVYQDEHEIVGFVTANCDDLALAKLRVTSHSREYALSTTHACV